MSTEFYVHMIESPSPEDLLAGDLEGYVLSQALGLGRVDVAYHIAATKKTFWRALDDLLPRINSDNAKRWPILHLSAHGSQDGLQMTNTTESIRWDEMTECLRQINDSLQGKLILAVSSCHGSYAIQEALKKGTQPYFALVGSGDKIPLSDLAVGFTAFYHILNKNWDLNLAHRAMITASGNPNFNLFLTEKARGDYRLFVFQQELENMLKALPLPSP